MGGSLAGLAGVVAEEETVPSGTAPPPAPSEEPSPGSGAGDGSAAGPAGRVRPIVLDGDPVLHRPCAPVTVFDDELAQLEADMVVSMHAADGVGLAANQIGVDARVFVMDCPDASGERVVATVVNPVLRLPGVFARRAADDEGCLSVPGEAAVVERLTTAVVTGVDVRGEPVRVSTNGLAAVCLQHEVDHLDGLLYVDRLSAQERAEVLSAAGLQPR
ncbi:peptide deformylase [uncultured Pseudokineococcus sp.]|uniref:peptide deformylase n=1 Tax=uncultured Pseudokineococcus sp. TaxID=1642928 RepID=UPI00262ED8B2|nr:peptide deformylase [uncultured Pseudokineococcus sp.]